MSRKMHDPAIKPRKMNPLFSTSFMLLSILFVQSNALGQIESDKPKNRNQQSRRADGRNTDRRGNPVNMMRFLDKDKDGKISKAEAPERMAGRFDQIDADGDGFLDQSEVQKIFANRGNQANRAKGRPAKGGPAKGGPAKGGPATDDKPALRNPGLGAMDRFDIAKIFKEMDKDGDGNLDPSEQQAIIERFKSLQTRLREAMRSRGGMGQKGGADRMNKAAENRYAIPKTEPVKPKRPGMDE